MKKFLLFTVLFLGCDSKTTKLEQDSGLQNNQLEGVMVIEFEFGVQVQDSYPQDASDEKDAQEMSGSNDI